MTGVEVTSEGTRGGDQEGPENTKTLVEVKTVNK